jgi:hypothetical protein
MQNNSKSSLNRGGVGQFSGFPESPLHTILQLTLSLKPMAAL